MEIGLFLGQNAGSPNYIEGFDPSASICFSQEAFMKAGKAMHS
jgi:hypothetical protein